MRAVHVAMRADLPVEVAWRVLTDIDAYPGRVCFVRQVRRYGPLAVGTRWDDQTTILGPPLWLRHTITRVTPPHDFAFQVHLPGSGAMVQHYTLAVDDGWTLLRGTVRFQLPAHVVDAVFGPLLARRLTTMLRVSLATAVQQAAALASDDATLGDPVRARPAPAAAPGAVGGCSSAHHREEVVYAGRIDRYSHQE